MGRKYFRPEQLRGKLGETDIFKNKGLKAKDALRSSGLQRTPNFDGGKSTGVCR
jgi:hypothetical protein